MKTLYFNRETLLGESKKLMSLEVHVNDNFDLNKEVPQVVGYEQKKDQDGNLLFYKDIYRTETETILIGYDETIKPNDDPILIKVHKTNEEGEKLYLEAIFEEGTQEIVDHLETTRQYDEYGNMNEPIIEEVQKTSISGAPLYRIPRYTEVESSVFDHVEEVTEETDRPVLIPIYVSSTKNIFTDPELFTIEEVLNASLLDVLNSSSFDSLLTDSFITLDAVDTEKTIANTGVGIMQLPVGGMLFTKSLKLEGKAQEFTLLNLEPLPEGVTVYLNTKKVVDNKVILASPVSSITLKFVNTLDKPVDLRCYCIAYNTEVESNA